MSRLDANITRYHFENAALTSEVLQVVDFVGQESISQLFRFDLNLVSDDPEIDFADVINKPATLTMMRNDEPAKIHGLVVDFQQGGRTADWTAYRATLVPRVWLLSLVYQSRVFQNMTVEEIVTQVLKDGGFASDDYRFALSGSYKPREYCAQYRETDLNFISRLLEFEGISFFFEHGEDRETMVITDDRSENPFIDGESAISYSTGGGLVAENEQETVHDFICREKIVAGKVVLKDYNYRTPDTMLKSESQLNRDMPGMYYEYGQHFKDTSEGDRLAKVRNEEIECTRRVMSGDSNCAGLRSGFKFSLQDHYRSDLDSDYLVTHLTHFGSQGAGYATPMGGGEGPAYRNEFTCIPAEVPYRPPRLTPEPRIPGIMTAKVETAGGDYAHIDEDGRYRVKMPFDLSERTNANASRAIRVAQPYTGSGYGMHFPVHAGTEMVWACIDGNVDRPLGLSTVPNPSQGTPVTSANKSINMIKTASNNVISMDDTIGLQKLAISTPYDNSISAGHDQAITVENDRTITVNGTHTETIKKDTAITISEGKYKHDVAAGTADYHVQGALTEKYDTNQKTTVANEIEITSSGSKVHITAATEIQLKVGASTLLMKSDGSIELNGVNLAVNGSASINIHGASVTSKADADHNIEGAIVVSKGSGTNTVSGGMVMLNP